VPILAILLAQAATLTTALLFDQADTDHDGVLDLEEFRAWFFGPNANDGEALKADRHAVGAGVRSGGGSVDRGGGKVDDIEGGGYNSEEDEEADVSSAPSAQEPLKLERLRRVTGLFAHTPAEVLEALASLANDRGLITQSNFTDAIAGFRITAAFRVAASHAPGGDPLALALSSPMTTAERDMTAAVFDVFSVPTEGGSEPSADFVELATALLALSGGPRDTRVAVSLKLHDPADAGLLSRVETRSFLRSILLLLCIGGGIRRVADLQKSLPAPPGGRPLPAWDAVAAGLTDMAFRNVDVLNVQPQSETQALEEGEVPPESDPALFLVDSGDFGAWYLEVVEPLLEEDDASPPPPRQTAQASGSGQGTLRVPPSVHAVRPPVAPHHERSASASPPSANMPMINLQDPR
jgi:hypothetical protein